MAVVRVHSIGFLCLSIWFTLTLPACVGLSDRHSKAATIARQAGLTKQIVPSGQFSLVTFHKLEDKKSELLIVYIEGDGYAFQQKGRMSPDPTPKSPIALELAAKDPHSSVLYIARPCQYLPTDVLASCDPKYWSTHRYAEEVIAAIDNTISQKAFPYKTIGLVGYSGGGTIAALIAARRQNVAWLVTVAANLDHKYWTSLHNLTPLSGSLNPTDYAASLQSVSQLHLVGSEDNIVPFQVSQSYINKFTDTSPIKATRMTGFDHACCWVEVWPRVLCDNGLAEFYCRGDATGRLP